MLIINKPRPVWEPQELVSMLGRRVPDIPGVKNSNAVGYQDLLAAQSTVKGKNVVVGWLR